MFCRNHGRCAASVAAAVLVACAAWAAAAVEGVPESAYAALRWRFLGPLLAGWATVSAGMAGGDDYHFPSVDARGPPLTTTPVSFANPDPYLERITFGTTGMLLEGQHVLSNSLLLNARPSRVWWWQSNQGRTERGRPELLFIDAETGRWSGGAPDDMHNRSTVTSAGPSASWMAGRHLVEGGLEYEDNMVDANGSRSTRTQPPAALPRPASTKPLCFPRLALAQPPGQSAGHGSGEPQPAKPPRPEGNEAPAATASAAAPCRRS